MSEEKHIALYYQSGSSDKEYHCHLTKKKDGWYVRFEFGRRGSSLSTGTKIAATTEEKATKVFDDLVHSKKLKGYCETAGQAPYVGSDKEDRITGILPQLLNSIEEKDLDDYFDDDNFCMQEKKDGKRILFRKSENGQVEAINRKGLLVGFPSSIANALETIKGSWVFDGELIGETIWFFDTLEYAGKSLCVQPYKERYTILQNVLDMEGSCVRLVATAFTAQEKRDGFDSLKTQGAEGVVFKRLDAFYVPGRPASYGDQLKFKFYQTCTCQVSAHNQKGKRSVFIQALDGKKLVDVGKVTVLPNFEIPKTGRLVEIQYLYRHVHGALYQPVYLGERDDLDNPDQISTFKIKEGINIEDEEES